MNQISLMQRVDAVLSIAGPFVDILAPTEDEIQRMRDGVSSLKRRIVRANREEDARQLQAALERLAQEE